MQIELMHYNFKRKYDKIDSQDRRDLTDGEIDEFLNEAIINFVETRYSGNNAKQLGFEVTQQRIDDLSTLVVKSEVLTPYSNSSGVYEFRLSQLTQPYMHFLRANVNTSDCSDPISLQYIQHDDLDYVLSNAQRRPSLKWKRAVASFGRSDNKISSIYIYTGEEFTIDSITIDYLKMPSEVTIGGYNDINGSTKTKTECDLPDNVHNQIIDIAVGLAAGVTENILMQKIASEQTIRNE